jgi:molybdate transport system substrate-binding protein
MQIVESCFREETGNRFRKGTHTLLVLALGVLALMLLVLASEAAKAAQVRITAFVGSASKPPTLEAKAVFEKLHPDIVIDMTFGGSGTLLNQMKLEQMGDIYMPGSDDFMDKAEVQKVVLKPTRKIIVYLVPVICVQHGNPKKIRSLRDMARPGVTVGLAKAGAVCLGDCSDEILRKAGLEEEVKKNCISYAANCELTQQMVQFGEVDAIIGWDAFKFWAPDKIDIVEIPADLIRVRNIPAAVSVYSKQRKAATEFISFLTSSKGKAIFAKHGYSIKPPKIKQTDAKSKKR